MPYYLETGLRVHTLNFGKKINKQAKSHDLFLEINSYQRVWFNGTPALHNTFCHGLNQMVISNAYGTIYSSSLNELTWYAIGTVSIGDLFSKHMILVILEKTLLFAIHDQWNSSFRHIINFIHFKKQNS